jgi:hypothetical protein
MSNQVIQRQIKATNCFKKIMAKWEKPEVDEISISSEAYLKLLFIINLVGDHEVSGFGKLVNNRIVDWYIPKQVLGTLTADIDEEAMLEMCRDIPSKELKYYKVDFHSHNTVSTTPSSTDKESYELQAESRNYKQFIAMIVNKSESIWCKNVIQGNRFTDVKVAIEPHDVSDERAKEIFDECKAIVEQNCFEEVKVVKPTVTKVTGYKQTKVWDKKTQFLNDRCYCCGEEMKTQKEKERGYCDDCYNEIMYGGRNYYTSYWNNY